MVPSVVVASGGCLSTPADCFTMSRKLALESVCLVVLDRLFWCSIARRFFLVTGRMADFLMTGDFSAFKVLSPVLLMMMSCSLFLWSSIDFLWPFCFGSLECVFGSALNPAPSQSCACARPLLPPGEFAARLVGIATMSCLSIPSIFELDPNALSNVRNSDSYPSIIWYLCFLFLASDYTDLSLISN